MGEDSLPAGLRGIGSSGDQGIDFKVALEKADHNKKLC
jgi:hypothetical protein